MKLILLLSILYKLICLNFTPKELTYNNYEKVIKNNDFTLILFHEPACEKCKKWETTFNEVAALLPNYLTANYADYQEDFKRVVFAKVDGYRYKNIAEEFEIETFPTMILYRDKYKTRSEYDKVHMTAAYLLSFLKKKLRRTVSTISNTEELNAAINESNVNILFCGFNNTIFTSGVNLNDESDSGIEELETIKSVFASQENYNLYYVNNTSVEERLKCTGKKQVILMKQYDQKTVSFDYNPDWLEEFIRNNTKPVVSDFSFNHIKHLIQNSTITMVYLYKNDIKLETYTSYYNLANVYKNRDGIAFTKSDTSSKDAKFLVDMFKPTDANLPTVLGLKLTDTGLEKYRLNKITDMDVKAFIDNMFTSANSTDRYLISEDERTNYTFVNKITAKNIDKIFKIRYMLFTYQGSLNYKVICIFI
jgi:hypothetical protein